MYGLDDYWLVVCSKPARVLEKMVLNDSIVFCICKRKSKIKIKMSQRECKKYIS